MKASTTAPASVNASGGTTMTEFPLLFTSRELVAGNGFVAVVEARGRALLVHESNEEWWLYGVEPGGIGEGGKTPNEANLLFVASLRNILLEIADVAPSFDAFNSAIQSVFHEVDRTDEARWKAARAAILGGAALDDPFIGTLKREPEEKPCVVSVVGIDAPGNASPGFNAEAAFALPAAA
jgi:hypothetical protein